MDVKIGDCFGDYRLKVIMYDPKDNWEVKFICINKKTNKTRVFSKVEMETIVKETLAFKQIAK
jgi:hypothetical protein